MDLYDKNVLEYAQIARSGPKSMICNIEGSSIKYRQLYFEVCVINCVVIPKISLVIRDFDF